MGGRGASLTKKDGYSGFFEAGSDRAEFDGILETGTDNLLDKNHVNALKDFEAKRVKNKIEYAMSVNDSGYAMRELRGGSGSIRTPQVYFSDGYTFSHIHPRESGMLGGTFSKEDIDIFSKTGVKTFRAVAKEGTYSLSKGTNYNKDLQKDFAVYEKTSDKQCVDDIKELSQQYRNGTITYSEYSNGVKKANNNMFVRNHNFLLNNQKKYGYSYALERSK